MDSKERVDAFDMELIRLLEKNARMKSEAIGAELNKSPATIRRRKRQLIDSGIIRVIAVADADKVGLPVTAIIALTVKKELIESVEDRLASRHEVKWILATFGRFDILIGTRFASSTHLSDFLTKCITKIEGIISSETFIGMSSRRGRFGPV